MNSRRLHSINMAALLEGERQHLRVRCLLHEAQEVRRGTLGAVASSDASPDWLGLS